MTMQTTSDNTQGEPIMDINTTPLIDVLLVLLIMFIITTSIQTHAVKIDMPTGIVEPLPFDAVKNKIIVDAGGAVLWNAEAIDLPTLAATLERTRELPVEPELHLQRDALAPYARVDEVLAVTKRVGVERMGFVGNEQYRKF